MHYEILLNEGGEMSISTLSILSALHQPYFNLININVEQ